MPHSNKILERSCNMTDSEMQHREAGKTNRLEVSVCVALLVYVRYGTNNLTETDTSFVLRQTIFSHNVVKQFTSRTVLQQT